VQIGGSPKESHAGDEANEAKIMVAMEVGDENMVDFASFYLVTAHLYLGSLPTIY
jgi:hypothetical protein